MEKHRKKNWVQFLFSRICLIDTTVSFVFFAFLFLLWVVNVVSYSHLCFSISIICVILLALSLIFIDLELNKKKKGFSLQLLFNLVLLVLYIALWLVPLYTHHQITLGGVIFSALILLKGLRLARLISSRRRQKKEWKEKKLTLDDITRRKSLGTVLVVLFSLPFIVFILGFTPYSVATVKININDQRGNQKGSNELHLSFYATVGSYDYLTDSGILSALNGSDIEEGDLSPADILLLVSDSQLKHADESRRLVEMVKNCTASGLDVWIWFVYNEVEGHYPSHMNYKYMDDFKQLFDDWVSNFSLNIDGIIFDNEMDELSLSTDDPLGSLKILMEHRQEVKKDWNEAVTAYKNAAFEWSKEGYNIGLVGMDLSLMDTADNDPDLQQLYGIVNNPPDIWERVSFMFYRGCEYHSSPWGRDYLYNMAEYHKDIYGERAVAAIGCMAYAAYDTVDDILKDIAILKQLDYESAELFEFKAFYEEFGYEGLIEALKSSLMGWKRETFVIQFYTTEYLSRSLLFLADILLNLY